MFSQIQRFVREKNFMESKNVIHFEKKYFMELWAFRVDIVTDFIWTVTLHTYWDGLRQKISDFSVKFYGESNENVDFCIWIHIKLEKVNSSVSYMVHELDNLYVIITHNFGMEIIIGELL